MNTLRNPAPDDTPIHENELDKYLAEELAKPEEPTAVPPSSVSPTWIGDLLRGAASREGTYPVAPPPNMPSTEVKASTLDLNPTEDFMARAVVRETDLASEVNYKLREERETLENLSKAHIDRIQSIEDSSNKAILAEEDSIAALEQQIKNRRARISEIQSKSNDIITGHREEFEADKLAHERIISGYEMMLEVISPTARLAEPPKMPLLKAATTKAATRPAPIEDGGVPTAK